MAPKDTSICDTVHCKSHEHVEKTMERLEIVSDRLSEGQARIITVMQDISRLSGRVEKLEKNQDEIRKFMYKVAGVITAAAFVLPLLATVLLDKL